MDEAEAIRRLKAGHRYRRVGVARGARGMGRVGSTHGRRDSLPDLGFHPGAPERVRRRLASIGIQGATLTHHLNAMETDGVLTRRRDPTNRRVHVVELTEAGEALFLRLRNAAVVFDRQLRAGLDEEEVASFTWVLDRLHANVSSPDER
jgi:MarR family transcriptional regulator, transcriptional regulator for hemolysin